MRSAYAVGQRVGVTVSWTKNELLGTVTWRESSHPRALIEISLDDGHLFATRADSDRVRPLTNDERNALNEETTDGDPE